MTNSEDCLGGYNLHTFTYNHELTCKNVVASKGNIEKSVKPENCVNSLFKIFDLFWPFLFYTLGVPKWVNTLFLAFVGR